MRSLSVLWSLIGDLFHLALPQSVAKRDAIVEYEALAAPAALRFRHALQIFQYAALEVIDLGEAAREQIGAGLFAANAAGAEHRHPAMPGGIEMASDKILELTKAFDAGVDGAFECAQRDLEGVTGIDQHGVRRRDQVVPVGGVDIGADLPGRIDPCIAERDDLLFQPDLQALKRHR